MTRVLGLAVPHRGEAWAVTVLLGLLFALTGGRDLSFYDSAELALVAVQGGLGHPVGQPLHTGLGYLLTSLAPASWALPLLNLLSAVPAALCAIPVLSLAGGPGHVSWPRAAAVLLGLSHVVFWEPATRIEVYALAALPALWALARWAEMTRSEDTPPLRAHLGIGLALGLTASANPYMAVLAGLAGAPLVAWNLRKNGLARATAATAAGGLLGLLPYLYVAWAAARPDVFAWGSDDLVRYFRGADYAHNRAALAEGLAVKLDRFGAWALATLLPATLIAGLLGAGRRFLAPALAISFGGTVAIQMTSSVYLPDIADYFGYLMVPVALAVAGAAALATRPAPALRAAALLAVALPTFLATPGPHARIRHADAAARALSTAVLEGAPKDAIVLAASDHYVFPMHYLQAVEGLRPDVLVLTEGLLDSSWYWRWIFRTHPDLVQIELAGTHIDRVRRFLDAQGDRPVLVETGPLSALTGKPVCAETHFARAGTCPSDVDREAAARLIADQLARLGTGAPITPEVLAQVAFERGELLWTLGHAHEALHAYLAGVPDSLQPALPAELTVERAGPLREPPVAWRRPWALGRPERNLYRAAQLLHRAGQEALAAEALATAAALGLPEAQ